MQEEEKSFSYQHCPLFPGPEYRSAFMTEVFELTYHGGGGFTYSEVWNMDIPKRRFNLKKIREYLDKVQEARDKHNNVLTEKTDAKTIQIPDHLKNTNTGSDYVSKVKRKN